MAVAAVGIAGAAIALAPGAGAHIGTDPSEIEAGSSAVVTFAVGHGCDGSPTKAIDIQIPETIVNAKPQVHPGWTATVTYEDLDTPIESAHGGEITERPAVIRFVADPGNEIPADQRDVFTLAFTAPDTTGTLFFKTVQTCEEGESAWIAEWDGTGDEPDAPAPTIEVIPGSGDDHGHGSHGSATTTGDHADDTTAPGSDASHNDEDAESSATALSDDSDSSTPLAIAGIVLGIAGIGVGGTALARSGRRDT